MKDGHAADITQAVPLLDLIEPDTFLAERVCDSDALIEKIEARGIVPVTPTKANQRAPRKTDFALYRRQAVLLQAQAIPRNLDALRQARQ